MQKKFKIFTIFILTDIIWQSDSVYYMRKSETSVEVTDEEQKKQPDLVWHNIDNWQVEKEQKRQARQGGSDGLQRKHLAGEDPANVTEWIWLSAHENAAGGQAAVCIGYVHQWARASAAFSAAEEVEVVQRRGELP